MQASDESVDQFAFRFKNILHQFETMGENLAEQSPNYVVSQFASKVQAQITPHLTMRAAEFTSLNAAIEAACRIENSFTANQPTVSQPHVNMDNRQINSTALHISPKSTGTSKPKTCWKCGSSEHTAFTAKLWFPKIYRKFHRETYTKTTRNLPKFQSFSNRPVAKCSDPSCLKWGCKSIHHKPRSQIAMTSQTTNSIEPSLSIASQMWTNISESPATSMRANASVSGKENGTTQLDKV